MTKHHGWCHTGCQMGPHSWWHDTAWQVQSLLPDKALQTTCPMSCCQSDYTIFAWHGLVSKGDMKNDAVYQTKYENYLLSILKSVLSVKLSFLHCRCTSVCLSIMQILINIILLSVGYCTSGPPGLEGLGGPCGWTSCSYWWDKDLQYSSCSPVSWTLQPHIWEFLCKIRSLFYHLGLTSESRTSLNQIHQVSIHG